MAKRRTGLGKPQKSHSKKTKKRLAVKAEMLASLAESRRAKKASKKKK